LREYGHGSYVAGDANDPACYKNFVIDKPKLLKARLDDPKRFQRISEREERSPIPAEAARSMTAAKYFSVYRGMDLLKGPLDKDVLSQLFWHVRPRTVIELGAFTGASAIWITDNLSLANIESNVFSVDIDLSLLHPSAKMLKPPNLTFIEGDTREIEKVFPSDFLAAQPHPLVLIDDAHEDFDRLLEYFHQHLIPGDYIVCEDTFPYLPQTLDNAIHTDSDHIDIGLEKLHIWKRFLAKHGDTYAVDTFFSDYFGYNASSNWDGYVRRMK
jgi:cephalosporin hydroxylase